MTDSLDLNIENYTCSELEKFLKISNTDDNYEIEKKIKIQKNLKEVNENFDEVLVRGDNIVFITME